jgi:hypothetical protein
VTAPLPIQLASCELSTIGRTEKCILKKIREFITAFSLIHMSTNKCRHLVIEIAGELEWHLSTLAPSLGGPHYSYAEFGIFLIGSRQRYSHSCRYNYVGTPEKGSQPVGLISARGQGAVGTEEARLCIRHRFSCY